MLLVGFNPRSVANTTKCQIPNAVLDLLRTAYPTAQGVIQEPVNAVYNALQFVASPTDTAFWGNHEYDSRRPSSEAAAQKVAAAFRTAAEVVTGGNSTPALLSYRDAEHVGVYVENVITKKGKAHKAEYFKDFQDAIPPAQLESAWSKLRPFLRFGKFDPDNEQSDRTYFEILALWEQRCEENIIYVSQM